MIDAGAIQKMDDDWFAIEGTDRLLRTDSGVLARINKKGNHGLNLGGNCE